VQIQLQLFDHVAADVTRGVRQRRHCEARRQLTFGSAAANAGALFHQHGADAVFCEVGRARQAVDAAADHNRVGAARAE
jgi:hypothetical protein